MIEQKLLKIDKEKHNKVPSEPKEINGALNEKETIKYLIFSLEDLVEVLNIDQPTNNFFNYLHKLSSN